MSRDYESEELEQSQRSRNLFNALLFPANLTGLAHIGIYTVCFLVLSFIESMIISNMAVSMAFGLIGLVITIEMVKYLHNCVLESASGATAAPDSLLIDSFDVGGVSTTFGGYFSLQAEYLGMIFPVVICFLPSLLYPLFTQRFDMIFYILLGTGTFYYPMLQMAVVLFDSSSGYNPFIHIISIIKTFFSYCILVVQVALVIAGGIFLVFIVRNAILAAIFLFPIQMYLIMVMMHLLGRFYYLKQDKLNWAV
jgi:hypothetical protein